MQKFIGMIAVLFVLVLSVTAQAGPIGIYTAPTTGRPTGYATLADGKTGRWTETDTSSGTPRAIVYQRAADNTVTSLDLGSFSATATSYSAIALSPSGEYVAVVTTEASKPAAYSVKLSTTGPLSIVDTVRASELPLTSSTFAFGINDSRQFVGVSGVTPTIFDTSGNPTELPTPLSGGLARGLSADGKTVVGAWADNALLARAGVWINNVLIDLSSGAIQSEILGVSPDGRWGGGYRDDFSTIWDLFAGTYTTFSDAGAFNGCGNSGLCYGTGYDALGDEQPILGVSTWTSVQDANAYLASEGILLDSPMRRIVGISEKGALMDLGFQASRGAVFNARNPASPVPEPGGLTLLGMGIGSLLAARRRMTKS